MNFGFACNRKRQYRSARSLRGNAQRTTVGERREGWRLAGPLSSFVSLMELDPHSRATRTSAPRPHDRVCNFGPSWRLQDVLSLALHRVSNSSVVTGGLPCRSVGRKEH